MAAALLLGATTAMGNTSGTNEQETLRVGLPVLPPWAYYSPTCEHTGIMTEQLRRVANLAGLKLTFVPLERVPTAPDIILHRLDLFAWESVLGAAPDGAVSVHDNPQERIAVSHLVRNGKLTATTPLRVGARNRTIAEALGLSEMTVVMGDPEGLADHYIDGRLDVLVGGRELVFFSLLKRGFKPTYLSRHTVVLGRYTLPLHLTADADRRVGDRMRSALSRFDWDRSLLQLRARFLTTSAAQPLTDQRACASQSEAGF